MKTIVTAFWLVNLLCCAKVIAQSSTGTLAEDNGSSKIGHATGPITRLDLPALQKCVQKMGFECTRSKGEDGKEEPFFSFRAEGYKVVALAQSDNVQLYNVFSDVNPTADTLNEWNQHNNVSSVYVDEDGNAVLHSDLITAGGITPETLEMFVKTFRDSVARWARFSIERRKAATASKQSSENR